MAKFQRYTVGPRFDIVVGDERTPARHHGEELALIEAQHLAFGLPGPCNVFVMDEDSVIYRCEKDEDGGVITHSRIATSLGRKETGGRKRFGIRNRKGKKDERAVAN